MRQPRAARGFFTAAVRAAWLALAVLRAAAAAATCQTTGLPAPDVVTLMASTQKPSTHGWVVFPNCSVKTIQVSTAEDSLGRFHPMPRGIERVASVPSDARSINVRGNPLSRGANFSMATNAVKLSVSNVPDDPRDFLLPPSLQTIELAGMAEGDIRSLDGVQFPSTLVNFSLSNSAITSFANVQFPSGLQEISVARTSVAAIDIKFPPGLLSLSVDSWWVWGFTGLVFPDKLRSFTFTGSGSGHKTQVVGAKWPASIRSIKFLETDVFSFEVRRSDFAILERLNSFEADVTQMGCGTETATREWIRAIRLCVYPDSLYDANYGLTSAPSSSSPATGRPGIVPVGTLPDDEGSSSGGSSSEGDATVGGPPGSAGKPGTPSSNRRPADPTDNQPSPPERDSDDDGETWEQSSRPPKTGPNATNATTGDARGRHAAGDPDAPSPSSSPLDSLDADTGGSGHRSSSTLLLLVLTNALSLLVGAVVYRVAVTARARTRDPAKDATYYALDTPTTALSGEPFGDSTTDVSARGVALVAAAFRTDKDLIRCRIDAVSVDADAAPVARGSFAVVFRGTYQERAVAVKQLPRDAWRGDAAMVALFVDEIRLCARLEHPKIVQFVGASWSDGALDLSVVSEFMAGGDLHSVLHASSQEPTGREWTAPWTARQLRSKALISLDVAEALVYLHSFRAPILHRELKAQHVLLDPAGHAKLSGFGISRELALAAATTGNVGAAAWVAPEVLRGEPFSEGADVFALGVLLVELDRCRHPYAHEPALVEAGGVAHQNTQIAVLVSTGQLRPSPSAACPPRVADLVRRCVSFDAQTRPTAMEAFYALRQAHKSGLQQSTSGDAEKEEKETTAGAEGAP